MEVPLQLFVNFLQHHLQIQVSILVLMEVPLQLAVVVGRNDIKNVSILVLMEVPLQL